MLVPVNLPRIIEDLGLLEATLTSLCKVEVEYTADTIGELARRTIVGIGIAQAEFDEMEPERQQLYTASIVDYQRDVFDQAWHDYCVALRRLGILLNDGDTDVFDCDYMTRFTLKCIWGTVETCAIDKPEFVVGGPQILAGCDVFTGFMLRQFRADLLRKEGQGEQAEQVDLRDMQSRYVPPACPKCGSKVTVTSSKRNIRYLICTNSVCEHSFKSPKASTSP